MSQPQIAIRRVGFTLIEMLTVIAITAVLMTIIVLPIIQSFNLTRAAEAFADAQDQGRYLTEKISREIGNADNVRVASNLVATTLNGTATSLPNSSMVIQVPALDSQGNPVIVGGVPVFVDADLLYTKIDIVPPAQGQSPDSIGSNGNYKNPVTGKFDPTLKAPKGQVGTPVTPSQVIDRYFVGQRDPSQRYNDPYTGLLMARAGGRDNLFVLNRAEVVPYVWTGTQLVANTALFAADASGNPVLDDPRFFVLDRDSNGAVIHNDHNVRVYHWSTLVSTLGGIPANWAPWETPTADNNSLLDIEHNPANFARTVVQTQISRYDMIAPQYDLSTRLVSRDFNSALNLYIPRITPCVQFRPTVVSNDPTAGQEAVRQGDEADNAAAIAPDVYKTEYGLWNNTIVRTFPEGYAAGNPYLIGFPALTGAPGFSVYYYDPTSGQSEFTGGTETFDAFTYNSTIANGIPYSFTQAALAPVDFGRSAWISNPLTLATFTPYNILTGPGKILASFGISEVGNVNVTLQTEAGEDSSPNRPNLPTLWNSVGPYTPTNDPSFTTGTWTGDVPWSALGSTGSLYANLYTPNTSVSNPYDINEAFNQAWDKFPDQQGNLHRFIDLRVVPQEDGTFSPLFPSYPSSSYYTSVAATPRAVTGFLMANQPDGSTLSKCRIVPGSEIVYGPDQLPGPNYGHPIRYSRTTHAPGPDQYKINYVDQPEPKTGGQVTAAAYKTLFSLTPTELGTFSPTDYDPTNFVSAMLQPQDKVGYVQFNSDPNNPLPTGYTSTGGTPAFVPVPFKVDYRFQFTGTLPSANVAAGAGTTDVFAVDYDTRQLMQVLLTIRNYPQSDLPNPQSITLKSTASIRNYAH